MNANRTFVIFLAAALVLLCWTAIPTPASASEEFDRGLSEGRQAALTHMEETGNSIMSCTSPLAILVTYFYKPKALAKQHCGNGVSEEYKQGFIKGFCETICDKHRECMKGIERAAYYRGFTTRIH
jgi:hypothetical protein